MKFSIIIPAYNVEDLIGDCLQSIVWQDYPKSEYEIIIVEDCSTDNTYSRILSLIDTYRQDSSLNKLNISVIKHDVNKRQGGGRNTGIKVAKGEYILFVDADDYYSAKNVLKELSSIIDRNKVSLIVSKSSQTVPFDSHPSSNDITIGNRIEYYDSEGYLLSDYYCIELWEGCYNRKFLLDNNLYFRENVVFEDTDWSFKMCVKAKSVAIIDFPFYCYRNNPKSTTTQPNRQHFIDNIKSNEILFNDISKASISYQIKRKFYARIAAALISFIRIGKKYTLADSTYCLRTIPQSLNSKAIKAEQKFHIRLLITLIVKHPSLLMHIVKITYPIIRLIKNIKH